ncbi:unnamed protein product [Vicia faba]|uniref:Uncharacterized protein n=1 Tax=Vicia faba TaxID=3906 RepID=A0AAV1AQ04_VICFA|nr:unnamed protein product [Vicia faba]
MRDQETDKEGNGLSIIGGPSLELNRSQSSPLSCLGSGIPSLVGGLSSKVIKCGASSSLSTSSDRTLRPSPERPAYPACAFGAPHSFNHLLVIACSHSPKKGETRESSAPVHVTNQTSLGPEFCEPPDLDQDLYYVV